MHPQHRKNVFYISQSFFTLNTRNSDEKPKLIKTQRYNVARDQKNLESSTSHGNYSQYSYSYSWRDFYEYRGEPSTGTLQRLNLSIVT